MSEHNKNRTTEKPALQRLEHVNLIVTDVSATAKFLLAAFPDWRIRGQGGGEWAGVPRRWAHVGDDANYITLNEFKIPQAARGKQRDLQGVSPGLAHVGIEVANLNAVVKRLKQAGYEPHHLGEDHPHRRNYYYVNEEGIEFEFVEYASNKPEEKNLYQ